MNYDEGISAALTYYGVKRAEVDQYLMGLARHKEDLN